MWQSSDIRGVLRPQHLPAVVYRQQLYWSSVIDAQSPLLAVASSLPRSVAAELSYACPASVGLMPSMLLGSAVGVAVVYGIEEGDLMAAQNKLLPAVKQHLLTARREATSLADDVGRSLRDLHSQHLAAAEDAARQVGNPAACRRATPWLSSSSIALVLLVQQQRVHIARGCGAQRQLAPLPQLVIGTQLTAAETWMQIC
jgi:hypothetical protein